MILPIEYKSKKKKNISEKLVRKKIFEKIDLNLLFLLKKRFLWMKNYFPKKNKKIIIELGSGSGCIKRILTNENIILTDIIKHPWIDLKIDMYMTYSKFNFSLITCTCAQLTLEKRFFALNTLQDCNMKYDTM